ncbi:MAG: murein hydrolase activator EnvC family protein [Actinomycetes bacterium]
MRCLLRLLLTALVVVPFTRPAYAQAAWQWPLRGTPVVARGFAPPPRPWLPGHRGVDVRARAGDPVLAAGPGVVGFAGLLAGVGVVAIHHADELETTYQPLDVAVRPGQHVLRGQVIGHVRAGHGYCGVGWVCVHWGLRHGADYLDPLQLVRRPVLRLLPIWGSRVAADAAVTAPEPAVSAARPGGQPRSAPGSGLVAAVGLTGVTGLVGALALSRRRRIGRAPP